MIVRNRPLLLFGVGTLALSSCGSSNSNTPAPPVVTPTTKVETQFGNCFATRYQAEPYSKATDPVPCPDLPPPNLNAKPASI